MAQWERVQDFPELQRKYLFSPIPIELRHYFASWIEEISWNNLSLEEANKKRDFLFNCVEQKIKELKQFPDDRFLLHLRLQEILKDLQVKYGKNALLLAQNIASCLEYEKTFLNEKSKSTFFGDHNFYQELRDLRKSVLDSENFFSEAEKFQEYHTIHYQELIRLQSFINTKTQEKLLEVKKSEQKIKIILTKINIEIQSKLTALYNSLNSNISQIAELQRIILFGKKINSSYQPIVDRHVTMVHVLLPILTDL
jgi:hypothetical protein